ncbi:16S rRNA (uracil1498-N3)-methyltransferase [Prosthecobacter fusiformis]|uniref:Ribosomal RNA small subunit methyltransferase E n=1 Tax=Prosthecobacter fusiformis TaxID=48464 RepID=A0A4V3FIB9_9BACT|nr:RsmE family RNA methyltransferase [Prosthecobacter fusiformis]TDU81883.1 16S rRNA (uracil1498-N3)-methyltransferase [Prosthecobacter fusiformis]
MSLSRFYLPAPEWHPDTLTLGGDEAAHCSRVLRRQAGDRVEVFDGEGRVAQAEITAVSKSSVSLRITEQKIHAALPHRIHLLPTMIKAEPFEWLLEKAVELGAVSIRPIITERTVVHLTGEHLEKKMIKWQRHMIESAKQCHTPFVTRLEKPRPFGQVIADLPAESLKLLPALSEHSRTLHGITTGHREAFIAIGPEGDFTPAEESLAQQKGFIPVTLGPLILRAETAVIASLAVLGHDFGKT